MPKQIYITRQIPQNGIELLKQKGYEITMSDKRRPLTQIELIKALSKKSYDAVLSLLTDKIDAKVFDAAPSVKIFANFAIGFDNFDVNEAKKRGIFLTNTPGGGAETVSEHTFAFILALSRRITEGNDYVKKGNYTGWDPMLLPGTNLKGKTLGIIGTGRIGCEVVRIAVHGFGMKALYYDVVRNEKMENECAAKHSATVDEVLTQSDVISIHVPLLPSTHHLINAEKLAKMKPTAFLVNTSRGPVIDEAALAHALNAGQLTGAALDVFEFEPKVTKALIKHPRVILTPHIASSTDESRADMAKLSAENIIAVLETGKPVNPVY